MNLTFNQSYEKNRKGNRFSFGIKKTESFDSGKPSIEEYRIIDPKYTPDWNKLKSILIF